MNKIEKTTHVSYMDTLKGFLIFLAVFGHFLGTYAEKDFSCKILNFVISSFHMPVFMFVSGYFSKNINKGIPELFDAIVLPAIPFEILYVIVHVVFKCDSWGCVSG